MTPAPNCGEDFNCELWRAASGGEDRAGRAGRQSRVEQRPVAGQNGEITGHEAQGLCEVQDVARAVFDADDVLVLTQARDCLWLYADAG